MRDSIVSREHILEHATLTLARDASASMASIAKSAGISRATLHRVYAAREQLVQAVVHNALTTVEVELDRVSRKRGAPLVVLEQLVSAWVPLGVRFHFLSTEPGLLTDAPVAQRIKRIGAGVEQLIMRCRKGKTLRDDVPIEWQAAVLVDLVERGWWAIAEQWMVPRDAVRHVMSTFVMGQQPISRRRRTS